YASRQGESWMIHMHGGLARYPIMSPGGMLLVACHEVGHHLGGAPKKGLRWASSEGQSDYYGTLRCVRELLNGWTPSWDVGPVDASAAAACDSVYANQEERDVCYVSAMMGQDLGSVLSDLGRSGAVHFDTPDTREVR